VRYPFDEWLDGREWTLVRPRDFTGPAETMVHRLRSAAAARGRTLTADIQPGGKFITIRSEARTVVSVQSETQAGGVA